MKPQLLPLQKTVRQTERYTYGQHLLLNGTFTYGGQGALLASDSTDKINLSIEWFTPKVDKEMPVIKMMPIGTALSVRTRFTYGDHVLLDGSNAYGGLGTPVYSDINDKVSLLIKSDKPSLELIYQDFAKGTPDNKMIFYKGQAIGLLLDLTYNEIIVEF